MSEQYSVRMASLIYHRSCVGTQVLWSRGSWLQPFSIAWGPVHGPLAYDMRTWYNEHGTSLT